MIMLDSK